MKTTPYQPVLRYIETARTRSSHPVKIDVILQQRIEAFRRAKKLHQTTNTNR